MKKIIKIVLLILVFLSGAVFLYFFAGYEKQAEDIKWGVAFSQRHTEDFGLDWKETYTALLSDLGVKEMKIGVHWNLIENEDGKYFFDDLDWQIEEAKKNEARVLLVMGMKTPRWPECHIPEWAKGLSKEDRETEILDLLEAIVLRYKNEETIWGWQVENEPFFAFGICPEADEEFFRKEVSFVRSLDDSRPILVSDTGEWSFWFKAARIGDIVGTTMYRKVYASNLNMYFTQPFPAVFYGRKAKIINMLFDKEVMCVELQMEPWGPKLLYESPLDEQAKSMDIEQFRKNIDFAKRTGLSEFYLWGAEWWYWMKVEHNNPEFWDEAKNLFK